MKTALKFALMTAVLMPAPLHAQCAMRQAFVQPDERGRSSVSVWADDSALLFGTSLNVNTDGTRRSYSVSDFWGQTSALNNLCNAMRDSCDGLTSAQMRERRILTQRAAAAGWPRDLLSATRLSPSIIPMPNGRPCAEVDGYLVSATALHRPQITDPCDISNYVDALDVAALVLPKRAERNRPTLFQVRGAEVGDLVVASNRDGSRIVFGVVGDLGPARQLGEASIAMNGRLLGRTALPQNYNHVRGRSPFAGQGWQVPFAYVLVFPRTRNNADPYMQRERIETDARARFETWGGSARLAACRMSYRPR